LLNAEAMSVAMMTTVVTHAVKRGPRTSTCCGPVILFDTRMLLLVVKEGLWRKPPGLLRARRKERARLLSSFDNNSSNPRRGTDRLRGAW
jgi:hypothetical protein